MSKFCAVILAGGSGERFWPLSTPQKPKQFLSIFGGKSLIRQAVERLAGTVGPKDVYIVTAASLVDLTRKELPEIPKTNIIGEPMRRDTGAAVALGVGVAGDTDDTVLGFFPADQLVAKPAAFRASLRKAIRLASRKNASQNHRLPSSLTFASSPIVTLGIKPTYPATGFGYVDPKKGRFVEKPDETRARQYIKKGYLWNAGMFMARAGTFRAAFAVHAPALIPLATVLQGKTRRCSSSSLAFTLKRCYASLPRISFDFAVMEKLSRPSSPPKSLSSTLSAAPGVAVVPADIGWDDVGNYLAFDKYFPRDANGNVLEGACQAVEANDNIVIGLQNRIAVLGVKNLVVVSTPDGILVTDKASLGGMKKILHKGKGA